MTKVNELKERKQIKQQELNHLKIVRSGRVIYLGTALVCPVPAAQVMGGMRNDPEVEKIAMDFVMQHERSRGWSPTDISNDGDGSGFDIRSISADGSEVRRIEVKGRASSNQNVSLTSNEWRKAQQLGDSYWLYVVWGCKTDNPQLLIIQDPARNLAGDAVEIKQVTRYLINAEAIAYHGK